MNKSMAMDLADQTSEFLMNSVEGDYRIKVHAIRYSGGSVRFRVEVAENVANDDGVVLTPEASDFLYYASTSSRLEMLGFTKDHLGAVFTSNKGKKFKITGYNTKARKRHIITLSLEDGGEYVWGMGGVAHYLGLKSKGGKGE